MKKSKSASNDLAALRKKAEEKHRMQNAKLLELATGEVKKLVQELETHQIELEIQNEELRRAQEELEESRRKYEDLYDFAPTGYFMFDLNGLIKDVNLTGADLLRINRRFLLNKPFVSYIISEDRDIFYSHLRATLKNLTRQTCEVRLTGKRGIPIHVRFESIAMEREENGTVYCRSAVSDVTEQKKADEEIRRLNVALKRKIGELERSNRDWEMFSHAASHELRSPLVLIEAFAGKILKNYGDKLDVSSKKQMTIVLEAAKRMKQLLDDLFVFGRASAVEIDARPDKVNMEETARRAFEELKPLIGDRNIKLKITSMPTCNGDPSLLQQVFGNLIGNAIKFTEPRKVAIIEVGSIRRGAVFEFYVRDNGVGFDMRHTDKLFKIFHRLHSSEDFKGTGAGLAIVRSIIEKHGGSVRAESKLGGGATFYFTLPSNKCP